MVKDMAAFDPSLNRRDWLGAALGLGVATGLDSGAVARTPDTPIRMNFNENPLGPIAARHRSHTRRMNSVQRYTADKGDRFRAQIAQLENVAPEQIFIGELLEVFGLHLALLGPPGGEFIYSEPGYSALVGAVAPGGGKVVAVPLNDRQEDDLPAIAAAVNAKTRAVYLVSPHNPSGTVSEKGALDAFIRDVSPRTLVLVDEAYLDFLNDYADRTAARFIRQGANVVVFRTFGKMYGLAGLSMGYAIVPKVVGRIARRPWPGIAIRGEQPRRGGGVRKPDRHAVCHRACASSSPGSGKNGTRCLDRLKVRHAAARADFVFFETGRPHAEFAAAMLQKRRRCRAGFPAGGSWTRLSFGTVEENAFARAAVESYFK